VTTASSSVLPDEPDPVESLNETVLDCADIKKSNSSSKSGVYNISVHAGDSSYQVYCDMETAGGGWTVFQRRLDGSETFFRPWAEYAEGFGNAAREFWLGNDLLADLTSAQQYKLRVDLGDWSGNTRYAEYSLFRVSDSRDKYRLSRLGTYTGNADDSLAKHRGQKFTTYDQDNDSWPTRNCATDWRGAWWYNACHDSNLNGEYNNTAWGQGVNWRTWKNHAYSLRFTEMKIRPISF